MLNVYFAVAANRVIVDSVTNQVSIVDLYEQLRTSSFPVLVPRMTLLFYVSRESGDPERQDLKLKCELAEKVIFEVNVHLDFKGEDSTRIVLGVDGLTLNEPGLLKAKLMAKDHELGVLDLLIQKATSTSTNSANLVDGPSTKQ